MRILKEKKPSYGHRRLVTYAQPITMFLRLTEEVEESSNPNIKQLWVQAVKDQQNFLDTYFRELENSDEMVIFNFYV